MELSIAYKIEKIEIKGKQTKVTITSNETGEIFKGVSRCAKGDDFNYEDGVRIALNRAISTMINTALEDMNRQLGNKHYTQYDMSIINNNNLSTDYIDPRNVMDVSSYEDEDNDEDNGNEDEDEVSDDE